MATLWNKKSVKNSSIEFQYTLTYEAVRTASNKVKVTWKLYTEQMNGTHGYTLTAYTDIGDSPQSSARIKGNETWTKGSSSAVTLENTFTLGATTTAALASIQITTTGVTDGAVSESFTLTVPAAASKCAVTSSVTAVQTPYFEDEVHLCFTAASGTANTVNGYDVQYQTGSTWSELLSVSTSKTAFTADSPLSVSLGSVTERGETVRIRVRVKGSAGASYYSDWVTTNTLTRNRLPSAPEYLLTSNVSYRQGDSITLTWATSADPDSGSGALAGYNLQYITDGEWTDLLTTQSTSVTLTPTQAENGGFIRYRVCAYDKLGASGGYTESPPIRRLDATKVYVDTNGNRHEAYFHYGSQPCTAYIGLWGEAVPLPDLASSELFAYLVDENGDTLTDESGNRLTMKGIWWM